MLELKKTSQFRRDYKRIKKRGYDLALIADIIDQLLEEKTLAPKHRDHALHGNYEGFRECHVLNDWLLIYAKDEHSLILTASRTGTHADLLE